MTSTKSSNKDLNSFLALHVSEATDTYLRGLAMLSCELAYTVKELREKQKTSLPKALDAVEPAKAPAPVAQKTLKKELDGIKPKKAPAPAVRKTSKKKLDGTVVNKAVAAAVGSQSAAIARLFSW